MAIRRYGPGKYDTILDSVVDNGEFDESVGEVEYDTFYGLITDLELDDADRAELNAEEIAYLKRQRGAIVHENSQGFVYIDYYTSKAVLKKAWSQIEADDAGNYEDGDDGDDDG